MAYRCLKSDFEDLQKRIFRIGKKLDKNGLKWNFSILSESLEEIEVIDYVNHDNIPSWQFVPKKLGKIAVDVVHYDFDMESLKLGSFEVIAVLEHGVGNEGNSNLIHIVKDGIQVPESYRTVKSICDHCQSDRIRNKTVLLQDETGTIKQVGTTCIKEYTGIDGIDIIYAYQDIHDLILTANRSDIDGEMARGLPKYLDIIDYLTACIEIVTKKGYDKTSTKADAWEMALKAKQSETYKPTAEAVKQFFTSRDFTDNFLSNIKTVLSNDYCKPSGLVAYAYTAYLKQTEYEKKKQAEEKEKALSDYVGNIGDKIEKELTLVNRYSFETSYSRYSTTLQYIYIFKDENGNTYKWKTAKDIESDIEKQVTIKGTIKGHEEYRDEKQTELTRCKVL